MAKAKAVPQTEESSGFGLVLVLVPVKNRDKFLEAWQAGETDLPVDAEYQGEQLSFERGGLLLKFAHSSFVPTPFGQVIPDFVKGT